MTITNNRTISVRKWGIVSCLAFLLTTPGLAWAQSPFSAIVVFGTSLSDPGNAFALRGAQSIPPDFTLNPFLIPSAPYAKGGHHFSNGPTWIEQYGRTLGLGDSVKAALATTDPAASNYAVGAARSYDDGVNFNLSLQVNAFLARSGGVASPQALYVIEMGSNDIRDALVVYAGGGNGGPIMSAALASIAANVQKLYVAGARQFLVWIPPNVGLTPAIRSLGTPAVTLATQLTLGFNGGLSQLVAQLASSLAGSSFVTLEASRLLDRIVASPTEFGFTNVTVACVTPAGQPFECATPSEFLFWDGIHPTRAGHSLLATEAAAVVR